MFSCPVSASRLGVPFLQAAWVSVCLSAVRPCACACAAPGDGGTAVTRCQPAVDRLGGGWGRVQFSEHFVSSVSAQPHLLWSGLRSSEGPLSTALRCWHLLRARCHTAVPAPGRSCSGAVHGSFLLRLLLWTQGHLKALKRPSPSVAKGRPSWWPCSTGTRSFAQCFSALLSKSLPRACTRALATLRTSAPRGVPAAVSASPPVNRTDCTPETPCAVPLKGPSPARDTCEPVSVQAPPSARLVPAALFALLLCLQLLLHHGLKYKATQN